MKESWERDFELPVLHTGIAHMVLISRDFEFAGGGVYSDTTSRAEVEFERAQAQAQEAKTESSAGVGEDGRRQGTGQEHGQQGGNGEGSGETDADSPHVPEVGQLMFVGPGQFVRRDSTVRVRVSHGPEGFVAALLQSAQL